MKRRVVAVVAWASWLSAAGAWIASGVLEAPGAAGGTLASYVVWAVFFLAFTTVGAVVVSRRPRHPIGWILLAAGLASTLAGFLPAFAHWLLEAGAGAFAVGVGWVSAWVWLPAWAAPSFGLLLFPTGHLPSRRWLPLAWLAAAGLLILFAASAFTPGRLPDLPVDNPLGIDRAPDVWGLLNVAGIAALLLAIAGSIVGTVVRWHRTRGVERQQIKWLMLAALIVGAGLVSLAFLDTVGVDVVFQDMVIALSLATVPVAMGIAILRHRVFDIDVVINRTLVYGALTLTLGAAYLGSILLLQVLLSPLTQESGLAIAASTLAVAALFRPLRAGIQAIVDRRFYRRRYDAARTLEEFGVRLRQELDLANLATDLQTVVRDTMQPTGVSLWLRDRGASR